MPRDVTPSGGGTCPSHAEMTVNYDASSDSLRSSLTITYRSAAAAAAYLVRRRLQRRRTREYQRRPQLHPPRAISNFPTSVATGGGREGAAEGTVLPAKPSTSRSYQFREYPTRKCERAVGSRERGKFRRVDHPRGHLYTSRRGMAC